MPINQIRLMCPNLRCRKLLAVPDTARGKTVRCGACATNVRIPQIGENGLPSRSNKPVEEDASEE